jgi:hypothetical protein
MNRAREGVPRLPSLLDERNPDSFRKVFGRLLSGSQALDSAIGRIRLSGVDLSAGELEGLRRLRIVVSELNAQTLEEEAFALSLDPEKRVILRRIQDLLRTERLELRSSPLAGWSPDFSIFYQKGDPVALLMGLHWVLQPFPHRGPAWLACFGPEAARQASSRFAELWDSGHEIGPPVLELLQRITARRRRQASSMGGRGPVG